VEAEGTSGSEMKPRVPTVAVERPRAHRLPIEWDEYTREILSIIEKKRKEITNTTRKIKGNSMKSKASH
jgi:hypothetical protein